MANIFSEPKLLKNWAIKLANACGGQQVVKTPVLVKLNPEKITKLMDEFVSDHNENTIKIANEMEEE
jgi:lipid A disaccharide synthetase